MPADFDETSDVTNGRGGGWKVELVYDVQANCEGDCRDSCRLRSGLHLARRNPNGDGDYSFAQAWRNIDDWTCVHRKNGGHQSGGDFHTDFDQNPAAPDEKDDVVGNIYWKALFINSVIRNTQIQAGRKAGQQADGWVNQTIVTSHNKIKGSLFTTIKIELNKACDKQPLHNNTESSRNKTMKIGDESRRK